MDKKLAAALCAAGIAWASWAALLRLLVGSPLLPQDLNDAGVFGDLFGGINALFTAFAFAAVWWTGNMQRQELELQREELAAQRNELLATRSVISKQRFDENFFYQLKLIRELKDSITVGANTSVRKDGDDAIAVIAGSVQKEIEKECLGRGVDKLPQDMIERIYIQKAQISYERYLSPLFRVIYGSLNQIDRHLDISDDEKVDYSRMLRSQLSSPLVQLMALNGAATSISVRMAELLEKYHMLKYISDDRLKFLLLDNPYSEAAFMPRDKN